MTLPTTRTPGTVTAPTKARWSPSPGESTLDELHADLTQTYQSEFHVTGREVRVAISDYADYVVTYHDDGAQAGELLSLSGRVAEAMRRDVGLGSLFEDDENDENNGSLRSE